MRKIVSVILIFCFTTYIVGCGGQSGLVDLSDEPAGASVDIKLVDGTEDHGVLLKKEADIIKYISTETKKPEDLELSRISSIQYSNNVYDLNGEVITESVISDAKGSGKKIGYGVGGFLAGGLVGFGAGALFTSLTDKSIPLIYPIIGVGIAGAIFLGMKGSDLDRETAIDGIRMKRYEESRKELDAKERELEQQKQDLKELQEQQKDGKQE